MAKRKKKEPDGFLTRLGQFTTPAAVNAVLGVLVMVSAVAGIYWGWQRWGGLALAGANQPLTEQAVEVTEPPVWLDRDLVAEVYQEGSLGELSLLDQELTLKVYSAFEMHPWVAKVNRVGKHAGGRVFVDLRYREPAAWVKVPASMTAKRQHSILPVDRDAVLLPPDDLRHRIKEFALPRISIPDRLSRWPTDAGMPWRDARLPGAVRIAWLLKASWQSLGLESIRADFDQGQQRSVYALLPLAGPPIPWGSAPGEEQPGELSADEKFKRLQQHLSQGRDYSALDLRVAHPIRVVR